MKTCACSNKARCAQCVIAVREERGDWNWRRGGGREPRRRTLGIFTGRVSLDGAGVVPFCGPGPVALEVPMAPGAEVSYSLVEIDGALVAEQVKERAA
jgi:hypothetical protein